MAIKYYNGVSLYPKRNLGNILTKEINTFINKNIPDLDATSAKGLQASLEERYAKNKRYGISNIKKWNEQWGSLSDNQKYKKLFPRKTIKEKGDIQYVEETEETFEGGVKYLVNDYTQFYYSKAGNRAISQYNKAVKSGDQQQIRRARRKLRNNYETFNETKDVGYIDSIEKLIYK